jgi:hypothetical protein
VVTAAEKSGGWGIADGRFKIQKEVSGARKTGIRGTGNGTRGKELGFRI